MASAGRSCMVHLLACSGMLSSRTTQLTLPSCCGHSDVPGAQVNGAGAAWCGVHSGCVPWRAGIAQDNELLAGHLGDLAVEAATKDTFNQDLAAEVQRLQAAVAPGAATC